MAPALLATALTSLVPLADKMPKPEDVKAGWTAFTIFLLLLAAVALLGWSLTRQLRKAQAAKDAGVFDDPDAPPAPPADPQAGPRVEPPLTDDAHAEPGDGSAERR